MRTTVTLAPDVAAAVETVRRERSAGVSDAVNELVRRGLTTPTAAPAFVPRDHRMGVPLIAVDDIAAAIDLAEGDSRR